MWIIYIKFRWLIIWDWARCDWWFFHVQFSLIIIIYNSFKRLFQQSCAIFYSIDNYKSRRNERIKNFILYMITWMTLWRTLYARTIQIDSFKDHINSVSFFMMFVSSKNLQCFTPLKQIFRIERKQFSRMLISSSSTWSCVSFTIFIMQHYMN